MTEEQTEPHLTPVQILATTLAYMTDADKVREAEERAEFVVIFNKMVTRGELNKQGLAGLIQFAFDYAKTHPLEDFLAEAVGRLAPLQKIAIYINALELMLADGQVVEAEQTTLKKLQDVFNIDHDTVLAIREVMYVKNDTRMFLHPEHPRNAMDAFLRVNYRASASS